MQPQIIKDTSKLLKVGITGEMGSGKTYVASLFEKKGIPVYNCDKNAKKLVVENKELIDEIKMHFGENIYVGNVYKNLANIVFDERGADVLKILSWLIHPYIYEDIDIFCELNKDKAKFCLIESAILFENKMETKLDMVIYVSVPIEIRKRRAMQRDNISSEEYDIRMKTQISSISKMRACQHVIYNCDDGVKNNLSKRVDDLYHQINYSHFCLNEKQDTYQ